MAGGTGIMKAAAAGLIMALVVDCGKYSKRVVLDRPEDMRDPEIMELLYDSELEVVSDEGTMLGKLKGLEEDRVIFELKEGLYEDYEWNVAVNKIHRINVNLTETSMNRATLGCFVGALPGFALAAIGVATAPGAVEGEPSPTPILAITGMGLVVGGSIGGWLYGAFKDYNTAKAIIDLKYSSLNRLIDKKTRMTASDTDSPRIVPVGIEGGNE